jgi:ketosteroid isomerase-like protein
MKPIEATDALRHAYEAVNRGEIEAALALMSPDVDWPNTVEGGRERGREAVRAYWTRLFGLLVPTFDPVCVRQAEDGRIVVHAQLRFSDPASGKPLAHEHVRHVFTWRDSMIVRMDASEPKVLGPCACGAAGCP